MLDDEERWERYFYVLKKEIIHVLVPRVYSSIRSVNALLAASSV